MQCTQVVGKWLNQHVEDTNVSMAKANAHTRGCDLWTRDARHLVWGLAYSGEYEGEDPKDAFRKARWRLWWDLHEDERKAWNLKGDMAREMVKGDLTKIAPPKLAFR